jgi:7,8-dihydropterin-6-yl-methyl-4-(beta-D-ribofuranosyl)aminobenzene 5'-phosphate synthase
VIYAPLPVKEVYKLKITTLVENTAGEHHALVNEHGISFLVEKADHRILFDTGQSDAYLFNAMQLNMDMSKVDNVILSHGHYDHSGGFRYLSEVAEYYHVWMGESFFDQKYGIRGTAYDYLGNNFDETFLIDNSIPYTFITSQNQEIIPGIYTVTYFSRKHDEEKPNPRFVIKKNSTFNTDLFDDELLLAIETKKGMVVLLGCAHPGMMNMLDTVKEAFKKPIVAVLGGTHLLEAKGERLQRSLEYLQDPELEIAGVSHCTGKEVMEKLKESNQRYIHNMTGTSFFFE